MSNIIGRVLKGKRSTEESSGSGSRPELGPLRSESAIPTSSVRLFTPGAPREKIGLFELSQPGERKFVDVVAVHGLQGDAYKTWEHENGFLWLRDILPADIPFARIMTFGYDSTVAFSNSVAKLEDKALDLLNRLSSKRPAAADSTSRPIVFICHSLGGIVAKKALILAHERSSDPDFKDILDNTKAIAFLGVPHKGSDSAWWSTFAANALKGGSFGSLTNTALVADLRKDSTTLVNISKQFVDRARNLTLYTFFETRKLSGVLVVDELSACLGLPNEKLFPVDANHRTICKIPSGGSQEYDEVGVWIIKLVNMAIKEVEVGKTQSPEEFRPLYYEVPNRRVNCFVGREDVLSKIDQAFSRKSGPCVAVLHGMGGQGKSQVALEYCYRKRNDPFSATFWVDATTESAATGRFQLISELIKTPTDHFANADARVAFVLRTIGTWSDNWLMVFDNYDNPCDFPHLQNFFPDGRAGAILVTSRHVDACELAAYQDDNFIEVPGLEEKAALSLLSQQSHNQDSNSENAKQIVERLGYHPLAITQAGAYIRKRKLDLSEFMDHYKRRRKIILGDTSQISQYTKKLNNADKETALNVFTTWELSFQQLQSQTNDGIEAKILTLLAFFDNHDISESFFVGYSKQMMSDIMELLRWLECFISDDNSWESDLLEDKLLTLKDLSLLQTYTQETDGFCHSSLHPLIKDWIRLRTDRSTCQHNAMTAAALVAIAIDSSWANRRFNLPLSSKHYMLVHLKAQEENYEEYMTSMSEGLFAQNILIQFLSIQYNFARFFEYMGSYDFAAVILEHMMVQRQHKLELEHPDTVNNMHNLVEIFVQQGQ